MKGTFQWDSKEQGLILGAYGYGFIVPQVLASVLAERYGGKWLYGLGMTLGCLMTLFNPLAAYRGGVPIMVLVRVIQGLFQV